MFSYATFTATLISLVLGSGKPLNDGAEYCAELKLDKHGAR